MGHPHPTVDLPGRRPELVAELDTILLPDELSAELRALLLTGDDEQGSATDAHVCATAWVLSHDRERILLADHATLGWSTPGGHLHPGETSREAALRELTEEAGLEPSSLGTLGSGPALVHVTDVGGARPHRHWNIGWLFGADASASARTVFEGEETVAWWPCAALPRGVPDLPDTLARLLTALR